MALQVRNAELVNLLSADFQRNKYPLVATGDFSGMYDSEIQLFDGTTITLLDSSEIEPIDLLRYDADVSANTATARSTSGVLLHGESVNIFDVSGDTVQLRLTAGGSVEVQRTAGSISYYIIQLRLRWILDTNSITSKYFTFIADKLVGFHTTKLTVDAGESHTIESGHQLLVHGSYTVNGALVNNGDLVIL